MVKWVEEEQKITQRDKISTVTKSFAWPPKIAISCGKFGRLLLCPTQLDMENATFTKKLVIWHLNYLFNLIIDDFSSHRRWEDTLFWELIHNTSLNSHVHWCISRGRARIISLRIKFKLQVLVGDWF